MASLSPDSRRGMQRRDSSRSTSNRRPRLLRASATEPSITTSNASRDSLANSQSSRRATDLLNRVAFVSGSPPDSVYHPSSPLSPRSPVLGPPSRTEQLVSNVTHHTVDLDGFRPHLRTSNQPINSRSRRLTRIADSGRYFSFPSFDTWEGDQQDEEKEGEMKSP